MGLSIGGQRIDKHYQRWWRLYSELYLSDAAKTNWGKMTSTVATAAADSRQVFLPLIFFFNRNPGLALPLIALQYHEVRIDFDLTAEFDAFLDTSVFKVWANYIYLDTEERRRFAQKGHEYLIEQVQHTGSDSVTSNATKQVRLSYNHPVKELVWCVNGGSANSTGLWNFCSNAAAADVVVDCSSEKSGEGQIAPGQAGCPLLVVGTNGGTEELTEDGSGAGATQSVGPVDTFKLVLNGQDRFKEQSGKTLTKCKRTNTTPVPQCQVSTRTPLRSSQKSTNQPVPATSPESTTRKLRSSSRTSLVRLWLPHPSTCSLSTTTFSASNPVWAVLPSPTKRFLVY